MPKIETKYMGGHVVETKQTERNGVPIGIIEGYTATWDVDRGSPWQPPDQFVRGAFSKAIQRHKDNGNRQVRVMWEHRELMGGIPIDTVREDDVGLWGAAEINLTMLDGQKAYSLAQQKVLVDFSIGWESLSDRMEDGRRIVDEAEYWHSALVAEPMNPNAQVTAVKSWTVTELEGMTRREIEKALVESGQWSKAAAKVLASGVGVPDAGDDIAELLAGVKECSQAIR